MFLISYIKAFLIGGLICMAAQVLIDKTNLTPAKILTGYVVFGVLLGAFNLYKPLVEFAGAGASVPLIGFGNTLAAGVRKGLEENGIMGVLTGGLTACAAGIAAAIFFSFIAALLFKVKEK